MLTFEELQHLYGNEWFRKQRAHLEVQVQRLVHISTLHFDQWNMLGFHNNMVFRTREQQDMLLRFNAWITGLIVDARGKWPESYLGPEPVRTSRDPADPDREIAGWHEFPTVRDYFRVMTISAKKCADEFDKFEEDARRLFDALPNSAQETIHDEVVRNLRDELPLRVLKDHVPEAEYERLIALVAEGKKQSGGAVE